MHTRRLALLSIACSWTSYLRSTLIVIPSNFADFTRASACPLITMSGNLAGDTAKEKTSSTVFQR